MGRHPVVFALFAGLTVFLEVRPLATLTEDTKFTFSWTFALTLLFIGPTPAALAVCALASILADLSQRRPWNRVLFNASQFSLSIWAGGFVGSLITPVQSVSDGGPASVRWLLAVTVACVVSATANALIMSFVVALNEGLPVFKMMLRFFGDLPTTDGLLLALAPVFVVIAVEALILIPVLLITVGIVVQSASIALNNRQEATHDQLTGIPNRRMFESHGGLLLEQAAANDSVAAVIHIDLDGFKGINDRLGHHYGDLVLKEIASRLVSRKRTSDHVARLGGDEFACILTDVNDAAGAEDAASALLRLIEEPLEVEGVPLGVSASLGVAMFPDNGIGLAELTRAADTAMYRAKAQATGVEMAAAHGGDLAPGRLALLGELREALETSDQLSLAFQPKVNLYTGEIHMVEALLRWNHPVHGPVPPGWYMPQAEQTDLMTDLTDRVMAMAMAQCAAWGDRGLNVGVAINASARNLHDLRFPDRVSALLVEYDVDPTLIELEITENTIMEDPVRSAMVLGQLRDLGVSLSIDDFGTGYSSLASLRNLTIDRIKIDRSFVTNLASHDADLTIVRAVVDLGRNLGLTTVAEGVETEEVLQIVKDLGCDEFQGFLASKPMSAEDITPVLIHGRFDIPARSSEQPVCATTPQVLTPDDDEKAMRQAEVTLK